MTSSLKNLKNLFVFLGISIVIGLALYTTILMIAGTAVIFNI